MSNIRTVLHLRIEQDGNVQHRYLHREKAFYIGKSPKNDLQLYGGAFAVRHPLFVKKKIGYVMNFPASADGEIMVKNANLRLTDLVAHDLLPKGKGYYSVAVKNGKMGYLFIDQTRIDFVLEEKKIAVIKFDGFSPLRVFFKNFRDDLLFRGVIAILFILNAAIFYAFRDYVPPPTTRVDIEKRVQRLANFIIKAPEPPSVPEPVVATNATSETDEKKDDADAEKEPEAATKNKADAKERVNPASLGVLALLSGTGESSASNSVVDFLVSKNLASDLNEVTRTKRLTVGKGGSGGSDTDEILNTISTGGIDDILGGIGDEVESVSLSKKGTVKIDRLDSVSGSKEALGARTEESLRGVLSANMGRLTYIYNKYLKANPDFRGEMRLEVTISSDGRVSNIVLISANTGNPDFEREIIAAIRRFRYDPIAKGVVKVVYPIVFNKVM